MFVEFVQDQVRIKPLGIVSQHRGFVIHSQVSQPIEEIPNARDPFEMEEVVAVGGGGTHEIGHLNTRVLHGFTVPVHEQRVLGARALRAVRLAFSRFQQLPFLFQLGGVLDETLVGVEIVEFFARGAFGRTAHVTRVDLAGSEESVASGAFLGGPAHAFDLFGRVGFCPVGGGVRAVIGQALFSEEEPTTTPA